MKNYSARKLLTMVLSGQHTSYCQRTMFPIADCLCLKHEYKAYQDRLSASAKTRVRKPRAKRPTRMHLDLAAHGFHARKYGCSNKPQANVSSDINNVTCRHCIKVAKKLNINPAPPGFHVLGINYANFNTNP